LANGFRVLFHSTFFEAIMRPVNSGHAQAGLSALRPELTADELLTAPPNVWVKALFDAVRLNDAPLAEQLLTRSGIPTDLFERALELCLYNAMKGGNTEMVNVLLSHLSFHSLSNVVLKVTQENGDDASDRRLGDLVAAHGLRGDQ
jgi:hypothetical protein